MSEESSNPPDLAAIDLSLSFAPAWAKEGANAEEISRLAARHDRPEREERGGVRRREDRSGGARGDRGDRRPPRREGGEGERRPDRAARGERREGRGPRRQESPEPRRAPEPGLTGWDVRFLPDRHGVDGLAKQIRSTVRAYPLFDLARLILEKSERYLVEFKRTGEDATPLFQLKADGTLWLSEGEAISHALASQVDQFYRRERVAVEPPKGIYSFVAVCGLSGTVLGPPNYHDYQTKLIRLHAERFAHMPFDAYKARIRMEKGEEAIAKWREEQSSRDVFFPLPPKPKAEPAPASAEKAPEETATDAVGPTAEVPASSADAVEPTSEAPENPVDASEPGSEPPAAPADVIEPAPEASETTADADEPSSDAPGHGDEQAEAGPEVRLESLAEVAQHFREHYAAKAVVRIRERVVTPGSAALNDSAAPVLRTTRGLWEELDRFPLPLAHTLGQQLAGRGLQLFKAHENFTYVSVARPKYLDYTTTAVSPGVRAILEYLEAHPKTSRHDQWKALLAARPEAEADRETALLTDLRWLLQEGHVIDFARRNLEVARKPKPQPVKAPKPPKVAPAAGAATAETPSVGETAAPPPAPSAEASPGEEPSSHVDVLDTIPSVVDEMPAPPEPPAVAPVPELADAVAEVAEIPVAPVPLEAPAVPVETPDAEPLAPEPASEAESTPALPGTEPDDDPDRR